MIRGIKVDSDFRSKIYLFVEILLGQT